MLAIPVAAVLVREGNNEVAIVIQRSFRQARGDPFADALDNLLVERRFVLLEDRLFLCGCGRNCRCKAKGYCGNCDDARFENEV